MKSIRLNKGMRAQIVQSMMAEFTAQWLQQQGLEPGASVNARMVQLREEAMRTFWEMRYGKYRDLIVQLPRELLKYGHDFKVKSDRGDVLAFSDRALPASGKTVDLVVSDEIFDEVTQKFTEAKKDYEKYEAEYKSLRNEISQVLESCSSTKVLLEIWPTAEQYLPPYIADPDKGVKLPMLSISRLEERLSGGK